MAIFDVFMSHSSKNKELARFTYYNGIANGLKPWLDEALLHVGDDMKPVIVQAIADSAAYLLFYSEQAMSEGSWVPFEMRAAKEKRERDPGFRIIVIKLDEFEVPEWWDQFLYTNWNLSDQPG